MAGWLGTLVAERSLENREQPGRKGVLRIGVPRETRSGEFECRCEIRGFGKMRRLRAYGVDGVQALTLALAAARAHLADLEQAEFHEEPAYLGLPVVAGAHFPKKFVERIERAVERVHASFYREAKKHAPAVLGRRR